MKQGWSCGYFVDHSALSIDYKTSICQNQHSCQNFNQQYSSLTQYIKNYKMSSTIKLFISKYVAYDFDRFHIFYR